MGTLNHREPKTPKYEIYGFFIYIMSYLGFALFVVWAYVPDVILHSIGIQYYPSRYWALAIPAWFVMLIVFIYMVFYSLNLLHTPPLYSYTTITDKYAIERTDEAEDYQDPDSIPEIYDIPISEVNRYVYQ
ncbi:hypothetical protein IWQ60_004817 [Tieghemiomyces parasiticus]|uniref:Phosphatidylinositol N-acetylglucosaminyltransferase subunit GPI19 n=1 Tax=Tieghemiomyces parasiticus TaxID=78921 RepID=A0A9W8AA93_9FUNG|nr:hypothetical protein IWQ60_004817 [Tieghemiomyces parasiticus]